MLEQTPEAIVNPNNTAAFSALLGELIRNKSERDRLHKIQQKIVAAFDIKVVGAQIEAAYKSLLT